MAELGYGQDLLGDFNAALADILECYGRAVDGHGYSLSENEAHRVDQLLVLHEQQVQMADRAELAAAIVESYRQVATVVT